MLAELFQHVIEEIQAAGDHRVRAAIEIDRDFDAGLLRIPLDSRCPRRIRELMRNFSPAVGPAAETESAHTEVCRELHIGFAIADHRARIEIDIAVTQMVHDHADAGFAVRRVVGGKVFVDADFAKGDSLRSQHLQQQLVRADELLARKARGTQTVLIADHHKLETRIAQFQQGRDDAFDEAELLEAVDLEIRGLLDQYAIAINEQDFPHATLPIVFAPRALIKASFSSGLPIDMRSASASAGLARMSRTTTPAASRRAKMASASEKRTSR